VCSLWKASQSIRGSRCLERTGSVSSFPTVGKIGASGEIRTLKHLFLRQAAIPIRARWHMVHRGGFEPPRPTRGDRVTAGPFRPGSRTCANLAEGRRIERPSLITMPRFSGPVAGHSAVPSAMAESAGVEPASLLREPLFSRQVPYRPAHSPSELSKNDRILVGPVGVEPTRRLLLRQLRMPVPPRAWLIKLKLDGGSVTQSGSTEES
jgi:hypothetical protein